MNRIHRVVFNQSLNSWQAVSETARGHTRGGGKARASRLLGAAALGLVAWSVQAADGGVGGDPYPAGKPGNSAYQLHAGQGGATGQGGRGGTNDSDFSSGGGNGGNATLTGATAGANGNGGTWNGSSGTGGTAGTGTGGAGGNGTGGAVYYGGGGGGGAPGNLNLVTNGGTVTGGQGGTGGDANDPGAGGGGGGGGYGAVQTGQAVTNTGVIAGGAGGAGGNSVSQGGGGGGGGTALYLDHVGVTSVNSGSVVGGNGGNGGNGGTWSNGPSGGGGGGGGNGVQLVSGGLRNEAGGTITGGNGGNGGSNGVGTTTAGTTTAGAAGSGGAGGDGINAAGTGLQIYNAGTITGGNGGTAGTLIGATPAGIPGTDGTGGVGVRLTGDGNTLVNANVIAGGTGLGGQANAVTITGNNNTLELNAGYSFTGAVVTTGTGNALRLGGTGNASFDVSGIGSLYQGFSGYSKVNTSTWTLTGTTTAVTPWTVSGGILSIANDGALGDVAGGLTLDGGTLQTTAGITTARAVTLGAAGGALAPDAGTSLNLSGVVSGAGALTMSGAGTLVLTGANNYSGATTISAGTLQVGNGGTTGTLGTGAVTNNAALSFNRSDSATVANAIGGSGTLTQAGAGTTVLTGNNTYSGTTTISAGTLQVGNGGTTGTLGTGAVTNNAALSFNRSDSVTVANAIGGTGTLTQAGTGTTVLTGNNTYSGTTTISAGALQVGNGGTSGTLGTGTVTNNATLSFNRSDDITVANVISGSGSVAQNGTGTLTLSGSNSHSGGTTLNSGTLVASNGAALGTGTLTINGGTLGGGATVTNAVAVNGNFNLSGSTGFTGPMTLANTPTTTMTGGGNTTLSGVISGNSGLVLDATGGGSGGWSEFDMFGGAANSYTGTTTVQGNAALGLFKTAGVTAIPGNLTIQGSGIVGVVAGEQIADTATVTVNSTGHGFNSAQTYEGLVLLGFQNASVQQVETIGTLLGNGSIGLGNSKLVVGQGSFSGTIGDGAFATQQGVSGGQLEKTGAGTLALSGTNTYTGGTALKGGTLAVANNAALGTGALAMDDGTTLAFAANNLTIANPITMTGTNDPTFDTGANTATLTGGISGAADLTKTGTGTLILGAANNTYTGSTTVAQGTLQAGVANAFAPASATTVASGATLATGGFNQTVGSLTNAGTVSLLGATAGSTLTVNGNYVGNNGLLRVGTVLGDSSSVTDKLVVTGSASGSTAVQVTNLNGLGGQTTGNGIQVVSAAGGISGGAFNLATPVSAGAYDYQLNTAGGGAYLSSTTAPPPAPAPAPSPAPAPAPVVPTYRADVPLYAALPEQLRQSNLAMLGNLHQRTGDDGGTGSNTTSPDQGYRQAWGRVISIDRDISQSGTVSPTSSGRLTGFQAGTDLWANANWRTGVYVGQLEGDMSVSGFARGVVNYAAGSNDLRSQYLGAYATWKNDSGLYVDGVLQAGRHRYTASPTLAFSGSGKGDSLLASIEVGQAFAIAPNWTIEPQLQLVHQRLSLDDTSILGAWVHQNTDGGWMARAGVRIKGEFQTGMGTLQPYARVNVYKRSNGTDTTSFIGPAASTPILTRTGGTSSEVALGATWQLSQSTSLYGELGKLWASGGDARTKSGVNGSLGVKVRW